MKGSLQDVSKLGQSVWYDNIRRGLLTSGELGRLIEMGITGLTSNPSIFEKAIAGSTDYDEALLVLSHSGKGTKEIFETLALEDIQAASDLLRPVYDRTGGADGYASLEVSPTLAHETEGNHLRGATAFCRSREAQRDGEGTCYTGGNPSYQEPYRRGNQHQRDVDFLPRGIPASKGCIHPGFGRPRGQPRRRGQGCVGCFFLR